MKNYKLLFVVLTVILTLGLFLTACQSLASNTDSTSENTSTSDTEKESNEISDNSENDQEAITVRIAHTQTYYPYDFVNEDGESDGYEVQVMKAVDELLPQYTFEFVPTSDDDLLIGIETGKYHGGTKGAWFTEERAEKYIFPQNYIGASIIGLAIRSENADKITDLESFAKFSGKLVPIAPQNAQWTIVQQYNDSNPDNQVELTPSEAFNIADAYIWVLEGRYDGFFDIKLSFENNILAESAPYADYADKLSYVPYQAIPTWPLFNKEAADLASAYDIALEQLREDGILTELSLEYFGEDIFQYVQE